MDAYNENHFNRWLDRVCNSEEQKDQLRAMMLPFIEEHPDLLKDHSWPEIRAMVERR